MNLAKLCIVVAAMPLIACGVSKTTHKKVLDNLSSCNTELDDTKKRRQELQDKVAQLQGEIKATRASMDKVAAGDIEKQKRIAKLLEASKDAEKELLQLRDQAERANKRLDAFRALNARFRSLVDTGKLKVAFRNGQMVLKLPSGVLFRSGRAKLSSGGKSALDEVLKILLSYKDRRFLIAGHTDTDRVRGRRFKNNWELSTARAVSVLEHMIKAGFSPKNLAAAGYGEFDPVATNDSAENKQLNRRIEIVLVPDLSELPNLQNPS